MIGKETMVGYDQRYSESFAGFTIIAAPVDKNLTIDMILHIVPMDRLDMSSIE